MQKNDAIALALLEISWSQEKTYIRPNYEQQQSQSGCPRHNASGQEVKILRGSVAIQKVHGIYSRARRSAAAVAGGAKNKANSKKAARTDRCACAPNPA